MAIAAWLLALTSDADAPVDGESLATVGLSVGLAVGAVLLLPIDRPWVRMVLNPVILSIPFLAVLELLFG
jgi:hypothetical protein